MIVWGGEVIPARDFSDFVRKLPSKTPGIHPRIQAALKMQKPATVYWSVLENGKLALLNFSRKVATVRLDGGKMVTIPAYEPWME